MSTPTPGAAPQMAAEHTKTPWFVGAKNDALYIVSKKPESSNDFMRHDADNEPIALVYEPANARHIVHCVNTHDALKSELETLAEFALECCNHLPGKSGHPLAKVARAALAKAKAGAQ